MSRKLLLLILSSVLILTGCGDDSGTIVDESKSITTDATTKSKGDDPCKLVTRSEAEKILGESTEEGEAAATSCTYVTESGKNVAIDVPPVQDIDETYSSIKETDFGEEVPGVGNEAFCTKASVLTILWARKGNVMLSVTADDCLIATQFATKAAERI